MIGSEKGITPRTVPAGVNLVTPDKDSEKFVTDNDPALRVMTDLKDIKPFQVDSSTSIDEANEKMIACGVRLLFVHDHNDQLVGLITSTDILGEKPVLFMRENGGTRKDINAQDLMTPLSKLEAIPLSQVKQARVSDIVTALKECRRHHMLVLQSTEKGNCVRGIFSVTQVGRQLGTEINPSLRASSFAQITAALG